MRTFFAFITICLSITLALTSTPAYSRPTYEHLQEIRTRFDSEGMKQAGVRIDDSGRVALNGNYQDREEVQRAFSIAQQIVGVRWVAPTTPENVRFPGTQGMRQGIINALKKSERPTSQSSAPAEKYGLVVGVGLFKEKSITRLEFTPNDAKEMFNYLNSQGFRRENLTLLLNEQATRGRILESMSAIKAKVRPQDTVVIFFSTHGAPPNELGNMNIIAHDTVVKPRERIFATSITDDDIRAFIEDVSPSRVVIVLDTCYSGAAFSRVPGFLASGSKDLFVEDESHADGVSQKNLKYIAGSAALQQKILISASSSGEKSWESRSLKQSFFTHYFIKELKRSQGDIAFAYDSAKPQIQTAVKREKQATQTPQANFIPENTNFTISGAPNEK